MWESRGWIRYRPHTLVNQDTSSLLMFSNSYIIVFTGYLPPFNHAVFSLSSLSLPTYSVLYLLTPLLSSSLLFSLCCKVLILTFHPSIFHRSLHVTPSFYSYIYYRYSMATPFSSVSNACLCHLITSDSIHLLNITMDSTEKAIPKVLLHTKWRNLFYRSGSRFSLPLNLLLILM